MSLSLYQISVPVFIRKFNTLTRLIERAQAHAEAKKFDANNFVGMRLAPDMLPFAKQVQIASDAAKFCCARITGAEAPKFEDNETTLDDLKQRIAKTVEYLKSVPQDAIDANAGKEIKFKAGSQEMTLSAPDYVLYFATPNLYFHVVTAYDILRHGGVEIGKRDYLA